MARYLGIIHADPKHFDTRKLTDGRGSVIIYDGDSRADCQKEIENRIGASTNYVGTIFSLEGKYHRELPPLIFTPEKE